MAETLATIEKRKSTKGFKPDQIPAAAVDTILKAGEAAPIGMGAFDTIHFTVVQDAELLKKISEAVTRGTPRAGTDIYYGAPTVIIVSVAKQVLPGLDLVDAGGVIQNFLLAATDIGIGSVHIFGTPYAFAAEPALLQLAGIPEGFKVVSSAALGYATETAAATPKPPRNIAVNRV
ncbi:MAG: nitroreductase family protein [Acidaminococcales bacterium]|jgi:nitroreductase|nr:nitroreductase family protein [Acidaminococcales bacterium]